MQSVRNLQNLFSFVINHPINKRQKLQAIKRMLKWQLKARMAFPDRILCDWIEGSKFLAKKSMCGITGNIYCGLHEFNEMGFLLHLLRPGDLFVDVGANVGSYSILANAVVKADVISIEPIPETFNLLAENIGVNTDRGHIEFLNIGIGAKEDVLKFTSTHDTTNRIVENSEHFGESLIDVKVKSLDKVLGDRNPTLAKIDTEGFEYEVLKGAKKALAKESLLAVIAENNNLPGKNISEYMHSYGYGLYSYDPFARSMNRVKDSFACNSIFVKNIDTVEERLRTAKKYRIFNEYI